MKIRKLNDIEMIDDAMYKIIIHDMKLKPSEYWNIADDWLQDSSEWYHAMVADEDLTIVLSIPSLQIYSWLQMMVQKRIFIGMRLFILKSRNLKVGGDK